MHHGLAWIKKQTKHIISSKIYSLEDVKNDPAGCAAHANSWIIDISSSRSDRKRQKERGQRPILNPKKPQKIQYFYTGRWTFGVTGTSSRRVLLSIDENDRTCQNSWSNHSPSSLVACMDLPAAFGVSERCKNQSSGIAMAWRYSGSRW